MGSSADKPTVYYGWFIVATAFFVALVTVGSRNGFGVFVIPMSTEFGWNRGTISLAIALGYLLNGLAQPFMGRLYDKVGGRSLILIGLTVLGFGNILLAFTNHIIFLVVIFGIVMSIAMSAGSMNMVVAVIAKWFQRKRATAIAIAAAGGSMGGLILVPLASSLIMFAGWRFTWAVLGLFILLAVPLVYFILKENPEEVGLSTDGDPKTFGPGGIKNQSFTKGLLEVDDWQQAFHSLPVWQLCSGYFVCGFTTALISAHFVPLAIEKGFSPSTAATAFGVMSALNTVGVMLAGSLGDRFGRKNILGLVYAFRGFAYALLLLVPGHVGLWAFAVVAGVSWVATIPLTTSLTADVYGLRNIGILSGIIFTAHQIGGATSIQFAGITRDITGSYTLSLTIALVLLAVASLISFSIDERKYSIRYGTPPAQPISHNA